MQNCGCCRGFLKVKGNWGNSGICRTHDCRTDSDCGHNCKEFKRIRRGRMKSGSPEDLKIKAEIQERLAE